MRTKTFIHLEVFDQKYEQCMENFGKLDIAGRQMNYFFLSLRINFKPDKNKLSNPESTLK